MTAGYQSYDTKMLNTGNYEKKVHTFSQASTESMMMTTSLQLSRQLLTPAWSGERLAMVDKYYWIYLKETVCIEQRQCGYMITMIVDTERQNSRAERQSLSKHRVSR